MAEPSHGRPGERPVWRVRARRMNPEECRVYVRNHSFSLGAQTGFRDNDPYPSALEYLLGAVAGDLTRGFEAQAARRRLAVRELEANVSACLSNPLVALGVVGEAGDPGIASLEATFYVSADTPESLLQEAWAEALERAPVVQTLARSVPLSIRMEVVP